jgi:hypothetical protein
MLRHRSRVLTCFPVLSRTAQRQRRHCVPLETDRIFVGAVRIASHERQRHGSVVAKLIGPRAHRKQDAPLLRDDLLSYVNGGDASSEGEHSTNEREEHA